MYVKVTLLWTIQTADLHAHLPFSSEGTMSSLDARISNEIETKPEEVGASKLTNSLKASKKAMSVLGLH